MKERFHGILNYKKDVLEQKLTNAELIELLVKHEILVKSNQVKLDKVKSLNRMYRPEDNEHLIYATIIFEDNCYFISENYINETVDFICQHTIKNGNEYLKSIEHFYDIKNESFINIEDKKEFYKKELDNLIQKKHQLTKYFDLDDFDNEENSLSKKVKKHLELNLHGNTEFNSRYIYGFKNLKKVNISSYFDNIEELVYLQKLIDRVKYELSLKDLKQANIKTFTTQEAICFFEIIGFLKPNEEISFRKQAEIISKLIGKSPDNIRRLISKFDSKDPKVQKSLNESQNIIKNHMNELGYPLG